MMKTIYLCDEDYDQRYEVDFPVISWERVWNDTVTGFKWRTCPALITGIYNRIVRTTSGDYTRWELEKAYEAFKIGGFEKEYATRFN